MKTNILKIAKRIFKKLGYKLEPIEKLSAKDTTILVDVFKSGFKKRVLISYLLQPFTEGIKYHHTNYMECYTAAEVFNKLGYCVDVVDLFNDSIEIDYNRYEVVYGLGFSLEKAFYSANSERILKIFYSTGCNPFYSYKTSSLQVQRFFSLTGKLIPESSHVSPFFWTFQYTMSDFVIALGNKFVATTYKEVNPNINIESVSAFYFDTYDIKIETKKFEEAKKVFLWFGSSGLLHKGLDILLEIFAERKDIILHICGHTKEETKFWNYYQPIIDKCSNIIEHGFVDLNSAHFKEIMEACAFCIFPTASEGGSPSLLNVMANGGLIPLTTLACGIDVDDLGYTFNNNNREGVSNMIDFVKQLSIEEIEEKSLHVKNTVRDYYTYDKYNKNMLEKIETSISLFK